MCLSNKHSRIVNTLLPIAQKSTISFRLASVLVSGSKLISRPMCNSSSTYRRGKFNTSEHAEAAAIRSFYGKHLSWSESTGWRVLREKRCKEKNAKGRSLCNTNRWR